MIVSNWDKWQTFRKDRGTPPWIKVYRNLLSNEQWVELTDSEKGQLISIWLLAADKKGHIPDNPKMVQRMAILDKPPNINKFIELGFLATTWQPLDNHELNSCPQLDAPEESRGETEESKDIVAPAPKFNFKSELIKLGVDDQTASDWLKVRSKKKSANTKTAFSGLCSQISKSGLTPQKAITLATEKSWAGFNADWVANVDQDFSDTSTDWVNKDYGLM